MTQYTKGTRTLNPSKHDGTRDADGESERRLGGEKGKKPRRRIQGGVDATVEEVEIRILIVDHSRKLIHPHLESSHLRLILRAPAQPCLVG